MTFRPLTLPCVVRQLARLEAVYRRPDYFPRDDAALARLFHDVAGALTDDQFTGAVTAYLASDAIAYPKPGQLLARGHGSPDGRRVADLIDPTTYAGWERNGYQDAAGRLAPCPACGRGWQWQPRLVLVHEHAVHRAQDLGCVGHCDGLRCLGPGKVGDRIDRASPGRMWTPPGWPVESEDAPSATAPVSTAATP